MEMTAAASLLLLTDCIWSHFALILVSPAYIISPLRLCALSDFLLLSHVGNGLCSSCL